MSIQEFILLGLETFLELQILLFGFFLVIYLMTITGNLLIFLLVVTNQHLHTPMYFFLANLSWLDSQLFMLFLIIYLVIISGNLLIIVLIVADQHLHIPMYFFLGNLSCLETCYSSTTFPKMLSTCQISQPIFFIFFSAVSYLFIWILKLLLMYVYNLNNFVSILQEFVFNSHSSCFGKVCFFLIVDI
uniref:G-protein coupled receptors family 1 profile domain-containing protein n=1 Tax=Naja naja TaxID=35670 RepID=A0A8C6Y7M6_NAJNA